MKKVQTVEELLKQLISHWIYWDKHERFYMDTLAPQLTEKPESGDITEREILKSLKDLLDDNEWILLPTLIQEKRDGKLRQFAKEKLRREEERKAREEQEKRKEQERLRREAERKAKEEEKKRKEQRARQAKIEADKKRLEKEKALRKIREGFEEDFLATDNIFKKHYSKTISQEEYETEKDKFVQSWIRINTKNELDNEQVRVISTYGRHIQVVARAGSGKTTTLVNRAIFLQKHCHIPPNQMILLAFNRKATEETNERLSKYLGDSVPHVMTFHALAYAIVHPEESLLYDDPVSNSLAKSRSLQSVIDDCLRDPKYYEMIRELMLEHFRADWERIVTGGYDREKDELLEYRRSLPNVSLRGEYLKSYGEKLIADFLFEHDIPYKYERNYWWNDVNYRPDFTIFLTYESGIIIEYFGLTGEPDYDELTEEKRIFWKDKQAWQLLEIRPIDVSVGRDQFFSTFKEQLEKKGVKCARLTEDEIWHRVKERAYDHKIQLDWAAM